MTELQANCLDVVTTMPESLISVNFMIIVLVAAALLVLGANIIAAVMNAALRLIIKYKGL